jgi:integrase/recombinase XerC
MTTHTFPANAGQAELDAARLLLARMGISPADLIGGATPRPPAPTFAEYVPIVAKTVTDSSRRAYNSYWKKIVEQWGERRLDEPTPSEIKQLGEHIRATVVVRSNSRGGTSAVENFITALRCLYNQAVDDGLVSAADNPASKVAKPRRLKSTRHAVPDARLAEINEIAATTGDDPPLDTLLLRLHIETACRRGGALALRPIDLDPVQCRILLREKGETQRWQPVSPTLMAHLQQHARERHAPPNGRLLRKNNGKPITHRRYDYLWGRLSEHLPWVASQQISTHWLRHTTLTWVERNFNFAVARAYAGHADPDNKAATTTYVQAELHEVVLALAALTGEPHPLAP